MDSRVVRHPIGVVAERTGLSPDVLRVWERRYRAVEPARANGARRLYSDADVERLRLMRLATLAGRSIGQVAHLPTEELARLVHEDDAARVEIASRARAAPAPASMEDEVEQARARARALDGSGLENLLRRTAALVGISVFLDGLLTPLLRRIDDERESGGLTPAAERLASATMRRVLDGIMQALTVAGGSPSMLVATPAGVRHEIEAVMAATVATAEGWRVTYLGADIPAAEIAGAAASTEARAVGVTVAHIAGHDRLLEELRTLRARLPASVPLLVGGAGAIVLAPELEGVGIRVVEDLPDLRIALRAAARTRRG